MNRLQAAEEMRWAIQRFAVSLPDEEAIEIPSIYHTWETGKKFKKDDIVSYGVNGVGDAQLYRVLKTHKAENTPDVDTDNYKAIGISDPGYPIWTQPISNKDAYSKDDIVGHNGVLYISLKNNNTVEPGTDDKMWAVYTS